MSKYIFLTVRNSNLFHTERYDHAYLTNYRIFLVIQHQELKPNKKNENVMKSVLKPYSI